jgi:hypothetical protein
MLALQLTPFLHPFQVRWADFEAMKQQSKIRQFGFVVGQTNWADMSDPDACASALTQVKYYDKDPPETNDV